MQIAEAEEISTLQSVKAHASPRLLTFVLLGIAFLNLVIIPFAIDHFAPPNLAYSSHYYTQRFFGGPLASDSWLPMQLAVDHMHSASPESVYSNLFFGRKTKFQYPPSSLLWIDLPESIFGRPASTSPWNSISRLCVLIVCIATPMTYLASLKAFNPVLWIRSSRIDLAVQSAALFAMTLGFYPLMKGFVLGQIQTWLTCFFAIAVLAWISGYEFLSGILIGLIISVKPQLAVLLLWGALQRRRKFLVAALLTVLPLELASLWRYGFRNQVDYLSVLSYLAAHGESFFPNQSVNGLLARMLRVGPNLTWMPTAFPPFNVYVYCGTFATSVLMIFLALLWRRKNHAPETSLTKFLMASLLVTMASPIAWEHHYGILISIYAALLPILLKSTNSVRALLGLTVSYLLSSNFFMFTNLVANRHWNFIQSYLFAGALTLIFTVVFLAPKACETAASVESAAQLEAKTS